MHGVAELAVAKWRMHTNSLNDFEIRIELLLNSGGLDHIDRPSAPILRNLHYQFASRFCQLTALVDIFDELFEGKCEKQPNRDCRNVDQKILPRMNGLMRGV